MWLGCTGGSMVFKVPDDYEPRPTRYWQDDTGQKWRSLGNSLWFTNMDHDKRHKPLVLTATYSPTRYATYDNYNAIEVSRTKDIPSDYYGIIGVPVTYLDKYCPEQFEIVGASDNGAVGEEHKMPHFKAHNEPYVAGHKVYKRIFIKRKPCG
jgi:hypothetical protein